MPIAEREPAVAARARDDRRARDGARSGGPLCDGEGARRRAAAVRRRQARRVASATRSRQLLRRWVRAIASRSAIAAVALVVLVGRRRLAVHNVMSERDKAREATALAQSRRGVRDAIATTTCSSARHAGDLQTDPSRRAPRGSSRSADDADCVAEDRTSWPCRPAPGSRARADGPSRKTSSSSRWRPTASTSRPAATTRRFAGGTSPSRRPSSSPVTKDRSRR